jgi:predicted GNAT family N-acyltransferase
MTLLATHPSEMSPRVIDSFMEFVIAAGEINPATMQGLIAQALSLLTLYHGDRLIGTAAIKRPFAAHRQNQFAKAKVGVLAATYPFELGWVVVDSAFRRQGHGRALVDHAICQLNGRAVYATTKSDTMRAMLAEFDFERVGENYPSEREPSDSLSLHVREAL